MAKPPILTEANRSSGALQIDPDNWFGESTLEHQSGMLGIAQMLELDEVTQIAIRHLDLEESSSKLTNRLGAEVIHVLSLLEIDGLPGRATLAAKYPNIPVTSLVVS
jgi:hypothetical protein